MRSGGGTIEPEPRAAARVVGLGLWLLVRGIRMPVPA